MPSALLVALNKSIKKDSLVQLLSHWGVTSLPDKKEELVQIYRLERFFYGVVGDEDENTENIEAKESDIEEMITHEKFAYIPRRLFNVSKTLFKGLPTKITEDALIRPVVIHSSELAAIGRKSFSSNILDASPASYI